MSEDSVSGKQHEPGAVDVLCVAAPATVEGVREAAMGADLPLRVEGATAEPSIRERLRTDDVDCLVLDRAAIDDDADRIASEAAVPVVLYTDPDPADVEDALLQAVDTLVERDGPTEAATFLVEKIVSLIGESEGKSEYALARALARVDDDAASEGAQFLVADDGSVVWSSEAFETVFPVDGVDADVPTDEGFYERLSALLADEPSAIRTVTRADRDADATSEAAVTIPTGDGQVHFRHSAHGLPAAAGGLRLEVFREVTPQVKREARLELLDLLVEQAQDGLYTLDENGVIDFCNESFGGMLRYEPEALIGRHASEVLAEGELAKGQRTVQHLQTTDDESTTVDMTFVDRQGERLEVSIHYTLLPSEDGRYAGLMGVARNITERKARERTLEQYRTLVESAADPMYVLDAEGQIELLNEPMAAFFGRPKADVIGADIDELLPEDNKDRGDEAIRSILRDDEKTFESFERWLGDADGRQRLYEVTIGAIYDDEEFVGSVGTLRDITERERRREELDLLRQVFARVLRHNIRSELSIIMGNTEIIRDELDGEMATLAETVLERGTSLEATASKARAIEEVLDSEVGRTTLSVPKLVEYAAESVRSSVDDVTVVTDVPASLSVQAHPKLSLAVQNLVENAVEHGAPLTDHEATPDASVSVGATEDRVTIAVADGGPGIPQSELDVLEEGSESPLKHGSGLGLWLINWIVDRSGGDLRFEHDGGRTTVTIELARRGGDECSAAN